MRSNRSSYAALPAASRRWTRRRAGRRRPARCPDICALAPEPACRSPIRGWSASAFSTSTGVQARASASARASRSAGRVVRPAVDDAVDPAVDVDARAHRLGGPSAVMSLNSWSSNVPPRAVTLGIRCKAGPKQPFQRRYVCGGEAAAPHPDGGGRDLSRGRRRGPGGLDLVRVRPRGRRRRAGRPAVLRGMLTAGSPASPARQVSDMFAVRTASRPSPISGATVAADGSTSTRSPTSSRIRAPAVVDQPACDRGPVVVDQRRRLEPAAYVGAELVEPRGDPGAALLPGLPGLQGLERLQPGRAAR